MHAPKGVRDATYLSIVRLLFFVGLLAAGEEIEQPFGYDANECAPFPPFMFC